MTIDGFPEHLLVQAAGAEMETENNENGKNGGKPSFHFHVSMVRNSLF